MRSVIAFLIAAALIVGAYVGSALVSIDALADAVRAGNSGEVVARTDIPRLRASLTGQIAAAVLEVEGRRRVLSPLEQSVIGSVVATVADTVVAQALEPAALTAALRSGRLPPVRDVALPTMPSLTDVDVSALGDALGRLNLYRINELSLRLSETADPDLAAGIRMRFSAFGWKLSAIELPRAVLRRIAENLRRR